MNDEPICPVTAKVAALRHSLAELRARAAEATFRLVLIWTLLGYRMVRPDGTPVAVGCGTVLFSSPAPAIRPVAAAGAAVAGSAALFPA